MFLLILHKAKSLVSKFKNLKSVIFEKEISLGILRLNGGEKKKSQIHSEKSCQEVAGLRYHGQWMLRKAHVDMHTKN